MVPFALGHVVRQQVTVGAHGKNIHSLEKTQKEGRRGTWDPTTPFKGTPPMT
jgi:hypothetical protein